MRVAKLTTRPRVASVQVQSPLHAWTCSAAAVPTVVAPAAAHITPPHAIADAAWSAAACHHSYASCSTSVSAVSHTGSRSRHLSTVCASGSISPPAITYNSSTEVHDYFATDRRPIILFDGVCNLCNGAVNFMLDWDKKASFRLAALQSNAGRALLQRSGRAPTDISSIVLVTPEASYIKSDAVLRIGQGLNAPLHLLATLIGLPTPKPIRDVVYDGVANNRYTVFGRTQQCRLSDSRFAERFIAD